MSSVTHANMERVFRHFNDAEALAVYLRGTRHGFGSHGLPDQEESNMHARLRGKGDRLEITLMAAVGRPAGRIRRTLARLRGQVPAQALRRVGQKLRHADFDLINPNRVEVDYAEYRNDDCSLSIQALTDSRLHLTVYDGRADSRERRVAFVGTVQRA